MNTRDLETGSDRIATPDELASWLSDYELVDDLVEPSASDHAGALAVREAIRDLLLANNGMEVDARKASATLDAAAREARLGLGFENGRPLLVSAGEGVPGAVGRIVAAVAELARTDEWPRLKACRDDNCHVAFFDHSRNRSRAWCSMEVCGNREKARSFRERHRH